MISLMMRVVLLQILHNQLFMKRLPVHLNLRQIYQLHTQQTYLVFESALLLLFSICFMCRSTYISIEKFTRGSFLCITQICSHCNNIYVWESQPYAGKIPAGNIMISAAILYTGSLPAKALRVFSSLNCATIIRKTFLAPKGFFTASHQLHLGKRTRGFN